MTEAKEWGWYHNPGDGHKKVRVRNRNSISTKRICALVKAAAPPDNHPLWGYLMKVFAAIATVAPGTSTDRLGKQTAVVLGKHTMVAPSVPGGGEEVRGRETVREVKANQTGSSNPDPRISTAIFLHLYTLFRLW